MDSYDISNTDNGYNILTIPGYLNPSLSGQLSPTPVGYFSPTLTSLTDNLIFSVILRIRNKCHILDRINDEICKLWPFSARDVMCFV